MPLLRSSSRIHPSSRRRLLAAAAALLATSSLVVPAQAQSDYPNRPVKIVVAYPPGGSGDVTGRIVADMLAAQLKTPFVVENVGGAGGSIGAQKVISASADGYTLLVGANNEVAINPLTNRNLRYDGIRDLEHIGLINSQPLVLVASTKAKANNVDEFVALAKQNPDKFSYGTSGVGTSFHLTGELVKQKAGLSLVHVPYRGAGPLMNDLLGGQVDYGVVVLAAALPHLRSGVMKAIGTSQAVRSASTPDVPALGEHKLLGGFDIGNWYILSAPKGTPAPIVAKLRRALQDGLASPAMSKRLVDSGSKPFTGKEDVASFLASESAKYRDIVERARIQE